MCKLELRNFLLLIAYYKAMLNQANVGSSNFKTIATTLSNGNCVHSLCDKVWKVCLPSTPTMGKLAYRAIVSNHIWHLYGH